MTRMASLILISAIVLLFAYFFANYQIGHKQKLSTVSAFNQGPGGLSIFYALTNKLRANALQLKQDPLFYKKSLDGYESYALISPISPISRREASLLSKFVDNGGTLIISFHDPKTWGASAGGLREQFDLPNKTIEDKSFENGRTQKASPTKSSKIFRTTETYYFYSSRLFENENCQEKNFNCYVYQKKHGKGQLIALAGLPLFSNGLIGEGDNRKATFRIVRQLSPMLVDEYRHFFSDKSFLELLQIPSFTLPIVGILTALGLFFIFGHSPFHEKSLIQMKRRATTSFHEFNEKISQGSLKQTHGETLVNRQLLYLKRLFPKQQQNIAKLNSKASNKNFLEKASELLMMHKTIITQRGRTK